MDWALHNTKWRRKQNKYLFFFLKTFSKNFFFSKINFFLKKYAQIKFKNVTEFSRSIASIPSSSASEASPSALRPRICAEFSRPLHSYDMHLLSASTRSPCGSQCRIRPNRSNIASGVPPFCLTRSKNTVENFWRSNFEECIC